MTEQTTMADIAEEMVAEPVSGSDFMAELDNAVDRVDLKQEVSAIYTDGQVPSIRDGLHLSDVIGRSVRCMRKMVLLHFYNQDQLIHGHQLSARFETGNAIHHRWQANISRSIGMADIEMQHIETFWKLLFTPDIIAPFRGEMHIWELKGYNDAEFGRLTRKGKLPEDAIIQNLLYQWFTNIPRGLIIVENKNDQNFAVWRVCLDDPGQRDKIKPYETIFNEIAALAKIHQETGKLPRRLPVCNSPTDTTPKGCAGCSACFASKDQRESMKRLQAWQ